MDQQNVCRRHSGNARCASFHSTSLPTSRYAENATATYLSPPSPSKNRKCYSSGYQLGSFVAWKRTQQRLIHSPPPSPLYSSSVRSPQPKECGVAGEKKFARPSQSRARGGICGFGVEGARVGDLEKCCSFSCSSILPRMPAHTATLHIRTRTPQTHTHAHHTYAGCVLATPRLSQALCLCTQVRTRSQSSSS